MRLDERIAVLEEKARDLDEWITERTTLHFNERMVLMEEKMLSFERWIEAHEKVTEQLLANSQLMLAALSRYNWMARGVMATLLFVGMSAGWLIDRLHMLRDVLRSWK